MIPSVAVTKGLWQDVELSNIRACHLAGVRQKLLVFDLSSHGAGSGQVSWLRFTCINDRELIVPVELNVLRTEDFTHVTIRTPRVAACLRAHTHDSEACHRWSGTRQL